MTQDQAVLSETSLAAQGRYGMSLASSGKPIRLNT